MPDGRDSTALVRGSVSVALVALRGRLTSLQNINEELFNIVAQGLVTPGQHGPLLSRYKHSRRMAMLRATVSAITKTDHAISKMDAAIDEGSP